MRLRVDTTWLETLERDGIALVERVVPPKELRHLQHPEALPGGEAGLRNVLQMVVVGSLATSDAVRGLADAALGMPAFAVRGILFDKSPKANWAVPWHQDLTITVRERHDVSGFGPWSVKAGRVCVQPPADVLERMVTIRLHVDDCGVDNGPLKALPGSHRHGRLSDAQIAELRTRTPARLFPAKAGDAVVMRPLVVHASERAEEPSQRRVIHIEYAAHPLPGDLQWAETHYEGPREPEGSDA